MNVIDNATLQRYQTATANMTDDQIVQYGEDGQLGNGTHDAGALSRAIGITEDAKNAITANNRVRQDFLDAVKTCCGCDGKPFAELPPEVLAAFKGTHASSEAGDLGLNEAGRVTSGKPLTARRIRAVLSAVQAFKLRDTIFKNLQRGCDRFPVIRERYGTILHSYCWSVVRKLSDPNLRKQPREIVKLKVETLARNFADLDTTLTSKIAENEKNASYRAKHPSASEDDMIADCKKGVLTQFFYVLEELNRVEATRVCDEDTVREVKAKMLEKFGYDDEFANGIVWNNEEGVNV